MISPAVTSGSPPSGIRSLSTISASVMSTSCWLMLAKAVTRIRAPSSSRMLVWIREAMNSSTSAGAESRSAAAFLRRIAIRVSRSGGWTSVSRPHSKRLRSRSSSWVEPLGRPVGADHDLLVGVVQRVEGVEELLLRLLLALEELDVVDQEHVDVAVAALQGGGVGVLDRVDHVVGERLGGDVADLRAGPQVAHVVADRVQQVGLAESGVAVHQQRVVGLAGRLGDGDGGGVGEPVGGPDHEGLEGVARVQRAVRDPGGQRGAGPTLSTCRCGDLSMNAVVLRRAPLLAVRPLVGSPGRPAARSVPLLGVGARRSIAPGVRVRSCAGLGGLRRRPASGSTLTASRTGLPSRSLRVSSMRVRSRPSSWLRVNSLGTATTAVFSASISGLLEASQTRWLGGRLSTMPRPEDLELACLGAPARCAGPGLFLCPASTPRRAPSSRLAALLQAWGRYPDDSTPLSTGCAISKDVPFGILTGLRAAPAR